MLLTLADYIVLPYFYPIGQLVRKLTVREEKSQYGTRPQRLGMSSLRLICYRIDESAPSGLEQESDDFNRGINRVDKQGRGHLTYTVLLNP